MAKTDQLRKARIDYEIGGSTASTEVLINKTLDNLDLKATFVTFNKSHTDLEHIVLIRVDSIIAVHDLGKFKKSQ